MSMLNFRTIARPFDSVAFSRDGSLRIACQGEKAPRPRDIEAVKRELGGQQSDALALFHPAVLPADIDLCFKAAQGFAGREFGPQAPRFSDDLARYCRSIGFATFISHSHVRGAGLPIPALSVRFGEVSLLREYFGDESAGLTGPSVFVSPWEKELSLGSLTLATLIAGEVGFLKLSAAAERAGLLLNHVSAPAKELFIKAYVYDFTLFLLRFVPGARAAFADPSGSEVALVERRCQACHRQALEHYRAVGDGERGLFQVIGKPDQRFGTFGFPYLLDFGRHN